MDTTARIKAKGLDSTGVTEQVARSYFDRLGSHHLAIVEYQVDSRSVDADGHQQVQLSITAVEPVLDGPLNGQLDDHVRTIQKALYRNRRIAEGNDVPLPLDEDEPVAVKDVLAEGVALLDQDEDGEPVLWDGNTDDTAEEDGEEEGDEGEEEGELPTPDDTSYEVHGYLESPEKDSCEVCRQPLGAAVHDLDPAAAPGQSASMVDA